MITAHNLYLCFFLRAASAMNKNDPMVMYNYQSSAVQCLAKILQMQKEENWMLPVMNIMCLELRLSAIGAENSKNNKNVKPGEVLEKCAECLMACFRVCAADSRSSEEDTKRWGMLALINQLLKVYFRINKLHLCRPLIRAIESSPYKDHFALAQQITYKFFVGRKAMFDSDYKIGKYTFFLSCFLQAIVIAIFIQTYTNLIISEKYVVLYCFSRRVFDLCI